jgi:hypothetical protein
MYIEMPFSDCISRLIYTYQSTDALIHIHKSHVVTLNSLEKHMLIYVLDLFDGGGEGGAEDSKVPP